MLVKRNVKLRAGHCSFERLDALGPACPRPAAGAVGQTCQLPPCSWQSHESKQQPWSPAEPAFGDLYRPPHALNPTGDICSSVWPVCCSPAVQTRLPGWTSGARLLGSPNPSLQKQAQHRTSPTYQETGSQWSTALSYREAVLDAPLPNARTGLRISAAGGTCCSLARLGQLNIPVADAGFVQMLPLIVPINLHEMCQEYSLAPGWKYWTNQAGLAKMACANERQW